MKVVLKFNLPHEKAELNRAIQGATYSGIHEATHSFAQWLRSYRKSESPPSFIEIYEAFWSTMNAFGVDPLGDE